MQKSFQKEMKKKICNSKYFENIKRKWNEKSSVPVYDGHSSSIAKETEKNGRLTLSLQKVSDNFFHILSFK